MKKLLLGITLALAVTAAGAQGSNFYAGGAIGQAHAKSTCDSFTGPGISCDDKDTSWKVLGGYQVTPNFAAEVAYIDFGKVEARGPGGTISAKAHALELVGLGILPIADKFSLYGKFGVYHGTVDVDVNTTTLRGNASDTSTDTTFGFGAGFDITRQVTVRAEWQRYNKVGGSNTGKDDIDVVSVGGIFRF